jgi:hypothetical protein
METTTYLLFVLGCLGAADILLFHSIAHGIRSHRDSVQELVAHSFRGPTYAVLFILVPNFVLHGVFAWALLVLLAIDVVISVWDFSLEQASRRLLGGLPSGEYVLHMAMAMVFGAFAASLVASASHAIGLPTGLFYLPARVTWLLRALMAVMAGLVIFSGIKDALAAVRLQRTVGSQLVAKSIVSQDCRDKEQCSSRGVVSVPEHLVPSWMGPTLVAAGIYNLIWGAWVVVFPAALFRLAHAAAPNYPQIWQCVGMIVGVYGIGYLIAARAPHRHWPIVLVGLLGKVFGPLGMAWSIYSGALPAGFAWVCVINDLLWWLPFVLILGWAWRQNALVTHSERAAGPNLQVPCPGRATANP